MTIEELKQQLKHLKQLTPYAVSSLKIRVVINDIPIDIEAFRNPEGDVMFDLYNPEAGYKWQLSLEKVLVAVKKLLQS